MHKTTTLLASFLLFPCLCINAQIESDFYTPPTSFQNTVNVVDDYGVDNDFATDDSDKLQEAIDYLTKNGGGKLIIPKGKYSFRKVEVKSNVHIEIDDEAEIRPTQIDDTKNYNIFSFGKTAACKNVSITNPEGEYYTINLQHVTNKNVTVFSLNNAQNFCIADAYIDDVQTKFSCFGFGTVWQNLDKDNDDAFPDLDLDNNGSPDDPKDDTDDYYFPHNGLIKHCKATNTDYGYGLVQVQSAKNVFFKDIWGEGGVTLRLESGYTGLNDLQRPDLGLTIGGIHDIYGENIYGQNGNATVMISPHAMFNGKAFLNNITSVNSGFAARVEGGFVSKKYRQDIGLVDGTFEYVSVTNVTATYGGTAQIKPKHFKYLPLNLTGLITDTPSNPDKSVSDGAVIGPAIGAVVLTDEYPSTIENAEGIGFGCQPDIIPSGREPIECANQTITLKAGWNLISLYIHPTACRDARPCVSTVFPSAEIVKTFDHFYSPAQPEYLNTLQTITAGEGYLVYNTKDETISISGVLVETNGHASLQEGWNLTGGPSPTSIPAIDITDAIIIKDFDSFYEKGNTLNSLTELKPGKAYFIRK